MHEHSFYGGSMQSTKLSNESEASIMSRSNGSDKGCFELDDVSPPTSPVVKGVVQKSDSVSWVLEMDDEAPEVLASRVVRRAGSFRSGYSGSEKCSQSPVPKRQKCGTPLQTSASATSILRRNNSERSPQKEVQSLRNRSKSVTIKVDQAKSPSRNGGAGVRNDKKQVSRTLSTSFHEPLYSSSPLKQEVAAKRMVHSVDLPEEFVEEPELDTTFDVPLDQGPIEFHRDKTPSFTKSRENRGLITCDTKLLAKRSTEGLKKPRKPKLGAGEALISGSNSEDDTDTTDESSRSSSSAASNSDPREVLSIEDALMQKLVENYGSNTPMDVSWSEHVEPDGVESNV